MSDEKLYRIKTKEGAHINEKVKDDGSRAAIQFDNENGLQGPVDLVEVDEAEYMREVYVEVERQERSFGQVILEDVVAPAAAEALTTILLRATEAGINTLGSWISQKAIPSAKVKVERSIDSVFEARPPKNKAKGSEKNTAITRRRENKAVETSLREKDEAAVHTQAEVDQIVNNMKFAALYLAAGIRELSNTVILDGEIDPEQRIAMEAKLRELSSGDVTNTIEFMLEEKNRDMLDQATIQLFEAFKHEDLHC